MGVPAVDLKDVPQRLLDLVDEASRSGELVLTHEGKAVARIIPRRRARTPRRPGSEPGLTIQMANDFDAMPEDFHDHV